MTRMGVVHVIRSARAAVGNAIFMKRKEEKDLCHPFPVVVKKLK